MYHPNLRPGAQRQVKLIGSADLVMGLPSYKNAQTAAYVARVALEGLHQYYPDLRTVLINADAGLKSNTRRAVASQASNNGHHSPVVTGRYDGLLGQGSAIAALLDAALALDAKAIIILDSQTESITPNWVAGLAHLILENKADLVLPRYRQWLPPDGMLSDLIVHPLFRALWGRNLRRPAALDFALSSQLAAALLDEDVWGTAVATFGLPPWLATYSTVHNWRIAQTALGEKYLNLPQNSPLVQPNKRLNRGVARQFQARFQDVLSVLFSLINKYRDYWKDINDIRSLPTLTRFAAEADLRPIPQQDMHWLLDQLALGWIEYRVLWRNILTADNLVQVESLAALPADQFYFPADLWARIIYDFAVVFNKGEADPVRIVASLFPLYQGRLAAFQQEIAGLGVVGCEGTVAAQAVEFEEIRHYFDRRWQAYEPAS